MYCIGSFKFWVMFPVKGQTIKQWLDYFQSSINTYLKLQQQDRVCDSSDKAWKDRRSENTVKRQMFKTIKTSFPALNVTMLKV